MTCEKLPWALCASLSVATVTAAHAGPVEFQFDASNFSSSTNLSNDWWGLQFAGTRAVYFSESGDGCEVSQLIVDGATGTGFFAAPYDVDAVIVHDREWVDEDCEGDYVLVEDTYDWYAQDDDGNVWYLGEDTTAWDDEADCLTPAGSWKAGEDGARPGVVMPAEPRPGMSYRQEFYEDQAEDRATILRLNAGVSIEFGEYAGCLVSKESTPLDPGSVEHKFYCSLSRGGNGLMLVNELKGKTRRVEYVGNELPAGAFPSAFPNSEPCAD
jgi:hypothetical protein